MSSKLQLVDQTKMSKLISLLEGHRKKDEIKDDILDPQLKRLTESSEKMQKEPDGILKETAIIDYLKKRQKYKTTHKSDDQSVEQDDTEEEPEKKKAKLNSQQLSEKNIKAYLKLKSIKFPLLSTEDLVYDLTHKAKSQFNLSKREHETALRRLKMYRMPASFIQNPKLKTMYVNTLKTAPKQIISDSDSEAGPSFGFYEAREKDKYKK